MTSPDFYSNILIQENAIPQNAFLITLILCIFFTTCFYFYLIRSKREKKKIKSIYTLIADIFTLASVMSAVMFVGRASYDFSEADYKLQSAKLSIELIKSSSDYYKKNCNLANFNKQLVAKFQREIETTCSNLMDVKNNSEKYYNYYPILHEDIPVEYDSTIFSVIVDTLSFRNVLGEIARLNNAASVTGIGKQMLQYKINFHAFEFAALFLILSASLKMAKSLHDLKI